MFYRPNSFVSSTSTGHPGQTVQHYPSSGIQYPQQQQQPSGRMVVRNVSGQAPSSGYVRQYTPVGPSQVRGRPPKWEKKLLQNNASSLNISNNVSHHHTANHLSPRPPQFVQQQPQQLPHYANSGSALTNQQHTPSQNNSGQPPRVQVVQRASVRRTP